MFVFVWKKQKVILRCLSEKLHLTTLNEGFTILVSSLLRNNKNEKNKRIVPIVFPRNVLEMYRWGQMCVDEGARIQENKFYR